jgi:hypothetical protein
MPCAGPCAGTCVFHALGRRVFWKRQQQHSFGVIVQASNVFIILVFVNVIQFRRYAGMAMQALV